LSASELTNASDDDGEVVFLVSPEMAGNLRPTARSIFTVIPEPDRPQVQLIEAKLMEDGEEP
jgi:hypothetical protein